jgi:hypothetical protein
MIVRGDEAQQALNTGLIALSGDNPHANILDYIERESDQC